MARMRWTMLAACMLALAACGQTTTPDESPASSTPSTTSEAPPPPPEDALQFCDEVGRRVSQADCAVYENLAQSATRGMAAFNAPDPMQRGETRMLQLAISFAPPAAASDNSVKPADTLDVPQTPSETVEGLPGETVEFQPLVGRFMRAQLTGVGFDVTPQSPARQEVTPESVTTWTWQVVARQGGARALTLTTVVEGCGASGECLPLRSTTQNYNVNVEVSTMDKVRDFLSGMPDWIKIVSAIIAAIAGLIIASLSLRNAVRRARNRP